jgi:hypothetical protein
MTDRRDPSLQNTGHREMVDYWCDLFRERTGNKYPFDGGRDAKRIKELRGMVDSDDDLRAYMQGFFDIEDEFIENSGRSLSVFKGCLPKVIQFVRRKQKPQPAVSRQVVEPMQAWLAQRDGKKAS